MPDPRIWPIPNVADTFATVGAVTTEIVVANPRRVDCEIVNDSTQVMYLSRGNDAVIGSGIRLNANGGSYHIGTSNLFHGAINAICAGGQANVTISEGSKP